MMQDSVMKMSFHTLVKAWVLISVLAVAAGWVLSAQGELNQVGYVLFGVVGVAGLWFGRKALGMTGPQTPFKWRKCPPPTKR